MAPMDRWVADQLIDNGTMTADYVTRRVKTMACRMCRAPVLACIDDLGGTGYADPAALSNLGEAIAVAAARRTWAIFDDQLCYRGPHAIRYRSAAVLDVYGEHVCHATPLPAKPGPAQAARPNFDGPPPF